MAQSHPYPATINGRPSTWQIWKQRWPVLVWILAGATAWWLHEHTGMDTQLTGLLEPAMVQAASVNGGRVVEVYVMPGQPVKAGDPLARLDSSVIDAEIAATSAMLEDERVQRERQFATAIQRVESELRELRLNQSSNEVEATIYRNELERLRNALGKQLITIDAVADVQAKAESMERLTELYPQLIKSAEEELASLQKLRMETASNSEDSAAYRARNAQMALLERMKEQCLILADSSGTVGEVLVRPGSVLIAGQPAITLLTDAPTYVVGFLPETDPREMRLGERLEVRGPHSKSSAVMATVESISPLALTVPDTTSSLPNRFVRGRPFRLLPDSIPADWTPGQSVTIGKGTE